MKKLGIAILGTGAIAKAHILGYRMYSDRCEVRAVCDLYEDKAKAMCSDLGLKQVDVYTDYHEMLKRNDIDIVSICLPPTVHAQSAIDSMNAGKHVLVEKPMAPSLEECDHMIEAARGNKVLLSPVAQNRFKTPVMKVKRLLEDETAGRVLHASVNSLWWRGQNYYDIWWRGTWEKECGGVTSSHAVHQLDLMQWMLGMPNEVTAIISNVGHDNSECEDLAVAFFQYPGMVAQLTASIVNHDEVQELVFQTERARISFPWNLRASKAMGNGFPERDIETEAFLNATYNSLPELSVEGHAAQIGNLLDAIEGKGTLLIDGVQGRNTIELIMAIYKASISRAPVTLPLSKSDVLYSREGLISSMPRFNKKTRNIENFETSEITLGEDLGK